MRKTRKNSRTKHAKGGFDPISSSNEFYTSSPTERPLNDDGRGSESGRGRKTGRHLAVAGRDADKMDPREKMALMAILKSVSMILLLAIAFFMLWKGIGLYEESILLEHSRGGATSPVLQEVALIEDFDIQDQDSREKFAERVALWQEADRLVRSADALLQRNIYDHAIEQCQDALRLDPSHSGALERLGRLYYAKEDYVEAVNAYIRLLSVDPSKQEIQQRLIQGLDALGDHAAVKYMAEWYLDQNMFDADIQRYLANALFAQEDFAAAAESYGRVLQQNSKDVNALEQQALSYMQVQEYTKALVSLGKLREINYRNQGYYKQIAVCNAQLQQGPETVQALGRAVQLFGEKLVTGWIQDPQLDPIRDDRAFQAFIDRIAGEETRLWLEKMAKSIDGMDERKDLGPQLKMPGSELQDSELLKLRR